MKVSFEERRDKWLAWFCVRYKREPKIPGSSADDMSKWGFLTGYSQGYKEGFAAGVADEKKRHEPIRRPPGIKSLLEIVPFPPRSDT